MSHEVRYHPAVAGDLAIIADLIAGDAGTAAARRMLEEVERTTRRLAEHGPNGLRRDQIAPGLHAVSIGRAVVAFVVDDDALREVRVVVVTYGGAEWARAAAARSRRRNGPGGAATEVPE